MTGIFDEMVQAAARARLRYKVRDCLDNVFQVSPSGLRDVLFSGTRLECEVFVQQFVLQAVFAHAAAQDPDLTLASLRDRSTPAETAPASG